MIARVLLLFASFELLFAAAEADEVDGRTATAAAEYARAAVEAAREGRSEDEARARGLADGLSRRAPRVVIEAPDGVAVSLDGASVAAGAAIPLDPGDHVVRASAPGKRAWQTAVAVEELTRVAVPELEAEPIVHPRVGDDGRRTPGLVLGGAGLATAGAAAYLWHRGESGWATAATGVAAIALGVGAILYFTAPRAAPAVVVTPYFDARGGGLAGRF